MANGTIKNLFIDLWDDLQQPDVLWQAGALLLCLLLAWGIARLLRLRTEAVSAGHSEAWQLGRKGLKRVLFPLLALLLVLIARPILQQWHHVNLLNIAVPLLLSLALVRAVVFALRYTFSPSGWVAGLERVIAAVVWGAVALHLLGLLPPIIDALEQINLSVGKNKFSLWLLLQGLFTVSATLLLALWLSGLLESKLNRTEGLDASLRVVFARLGRALLVLVAILVGLPLVGIDLTTFSVFGGALGVGLGFGLQKIASNYVSGFIILLDRSIRIGNMITVDGHSGEVMQITTRYTVLRGLTGVEAIVPNELLISSVVHNETYTNSRVRLALSVQVSYASDLERAMAILVAAAKSHPRVLHDPEPGAFLVAFEDNGIKLELGYWISDPQEGTIGARSELNLMIWREFKAAGIEIPYPRREVRLIGGNGGKPPQIQ